MAELGRLLMYEASRDWLVCDVIQLVIFTYILLMSGWKIYNQQTLI